MADSKVTDLTAATSVNAADVVYLVQTGADKKLSISTLLANLPNTLSKFSGVVALGGAYQTVSNAAVIDGTHTNTHITNSANSALTIADGSYDGQIKIITMTSGVHSSTLAGSNLLTSPIVFFRVGHTAMLHWLETHDKWSILGAGSSGSLDGGGA